MTEKRYINDVNEIYDTWLGHMGNAPPTEWEIKEKEYFLVGVTHHQEDAEDICKVLNELAEENQQLRKLLDIGKTNAKDIVDVLNMQQSKIIELSKENKQLEHDLALYEENNTNEVLSQLRIELTSRLNDCIEEFKQ